MELHFFLECVSVCLVELFEDVVDHITDTARLALRWQEYQLYRLNELWLYPDFVKTDGQVAYVPFTQFTKHHNLTMYKILPYRGIKNRWNCLSFSDMRHSACFICDPPGIVYFTLNWVDCHCFITSVLFHVRELHMAQFHHFAMICHVVTIKISVSEGVGVSSFTLLRYSNLYKSQHIRAFKILNNLSINYVQIVDKLLLGRSKQLLAIC